jgi:hypothetical protein
MRVSNAKFRQGSESAVSAQPNLDIKRLLPLAHRHGCESLPHSSAREVRIMSLGNRHAIPKHGRNRGHIATLAGRIVKRTRRRGLGQTALSSGLSRKMMICGVGQNTTCSACSSQFGADSRPSRTGTVI